MQKIKKPKETLSKEGQKQQVMMKAQLIKAVKRNMHTMPAASRKFMEEKMIKAFDSGFFQKQPRFTLEEDISVTGTSEENTVPQRVILADFYLPYSYHGKGNTINIVLGNTGNTDEEDPVEPVEPIVADFDGDDFNDNDFFTND